MADKLMRAQVSIPLDSNIPEDAIVNTFYFDADEWAGRTDGWVHDGIMSLLTDFYQSIDSLLYPNTIASQAVVKLYDMEDPEPRVAEHVDTIDLTAGPGTPMPNEVAICLSFKASPQAGVNPARRRGRVYLGPVSMTWDTVVDSQNRPDDALLTAIANAADGLVQGYNTGAPADSSIRWAIYSPTTRENGATMGDSFNDVAEGWIDNAWDTQRRRGCSPTSRTTFVR